MDYIPVMVSERLINVEGDYIGKSVYIGGQFRSFNRHEEKKNRLVLSVFARELEVLDSDYDEDAANQIFLDGYICKDRKGSKSAQNTARILHRPKRLHR